MKNDAIQPAIQAHELGCDNHDGTTLQPTDIFFAIPPNDIGSLVSANTTLYSENMDKQVRLSNTIRMKYLFMLIVVGVTWAASLTLFHQHFILSSKTLPLGHVYFWIGSVSVYTMLLYFTLKLTDLSKLHIAKLLFFGMLWGGVSVYLLHSFVLDHGLGGSIPGHLLFWPITLGLYSLLPLWLLRNEERYTLPTCTYVGKEGVSQFILRNKRIYERTLRFVDVEEIHSFETTMYSRDGSETPGMAICDFVDRSGNCLFRITYAVVADEPESYPAESMFHFARSAALSYDEHNKQ